jgi:hypothetical protein
VETKAPLAVLAAWFAIGVALLSASAGKHDRYAAPILPALAVFAAIGLADLRSRFPRGALAAVLATIWVVSLSIQMLIVPRMQDRYREQAQCARRFDTRASRGEYVYLLDIPNNRRVQLAYYLTMHARAVDSVAELPPGSSLIVAPAEAMGGVAPARASEVLERCSTSDGLLELARVEFPEP